MTFHIATYQEEFICMKGKVFLTLKNFSTFISVFPIPALYPQSSARNWSARRKSNEYLWVTNVESSALTAMDATLSASTSLTPPSPHHHFLQPHHR